MEKTYVDSNDNRIFIGALRGRFMAVHLVDDRRRGYVVDASDPEGGFGTPDCPSSYGRPCMTWFGPGERYPSARIALRKMEEAMDMNMDMNPECKSCRCAHCGAPVANTPDDGRTLHFCDDDCAVADGRCPGCGSADSHIRDREGHRIPHPMGPECEGDWPEQN